MEKIQNNPTNITVQQNCKNRVGVGVGFWQIKLPCSNWGGGRFLNLHPALYSIYRILVVHEENLWRSPCIAMHTIERSM